MEYLLLDDGLGVAVRIGQHGNSSLCIGILTAFHDAEQGSNKGIYRRLSDRGVLTAARDSKGVQVLGDLCQCCISPGENSNLVRLRTEIQEPEDMLRYAGIVCRAEVAE